MRLRSAQKLFCLLTIGLLLGSPKAWALRTKVGPDYQEPSVAAPQDWGKPLQAEISMSDPLVIWYVNGGSAYPNTLALASAVTVTGRAVMVKLAPTKVSV